MNSCLAGPPGFFQKDPRMKLFRNLTLIFTAFILCAASASAQIDKPVKGKRYKLAKNHGPWMIMVAAIRDVDDDTRRIEGGMSAWDAADGIVFALREQGIPAYVFSQDEKMGEISSPASSEPSGRRYVAQHGYISVMAGNFSTNQDRMAKKKLEEIKTKFNPAFLSDEKNGGILPKTPGRPSPFGRAFLTVNPLWEGEVRDTEEDEFVVNLNAGQKYSLLQNKSKYTLIVASFNGSTLMQVGNNSSSKAIGFFDKHFGKSLDDCAENAMQFTDKLRNAKKYGYETNYDAWVYHDKYKSIVTIGSFDSKGDPAIKTLATQFGGKMVRHPKSGEDVLAGEAFTVPRVPRPGELPTYSWIFDTQPRIMEVPRVK